MPENRTLSQSGGALAEFDTTDDQLTEDRPADLRRYLVGFETIRTLDASLPDPGYVVRTAELDTLGRAAIVALPEPVVPQFVSTAGIEYVLDLDRL
jgi:hypothetical protein